MTSVLQEILECIFEKYCYESYFELDDKEYDRVVEIIGKQYDSLYLQIYDLIFKREIGQYEFNSEKNAVKYFIKKLSFILQKCEDGEINPFSMINNTADEINLMMNQLFFVYYIHYATQRFHKTKSARKI